MAGPTFKTLATFLFLAFFSGPVLHAQAQTPSPAAAKAPSIPSIPSAPPKVCIIPVRQDIDESIIYVIRRGMKEAIDQKADIVILDMDTYGGSIFVTEEIFKILNKFPHQDTLYTYVNTRAGSAGSFIAAATHKIYMAPGSVIGAAAPVNSDGTDINKTMNMKIKSFVRGIVRAQAERQGHRADVFESMVDSDMGLSIDGKEIVAKGSLLTLTSEEALKEYGNPKKPLLSSGTMPTIESVIEKVAGPDAVVTKIEPTGLETLASWIVTIAPYLLAAAMICGYIEFKTPGFGVFGITAIVLALICFFGHYVAGLSGYENVLIFLIGVALIAAELFLFTGTLLPGILGTAMVVFSLLMATIDHYPQDGFLPPASAWEDAVIQLAISMGIAIVGAVILARILPKTTLFRSMVLQSTNTPLPPASAPHSLVGTRGRSITPLRPSGTARFDGEPVDVVTQGDFIDADQTVEVIHVEGSRVVVTAISPGSSA